MKANDLRKAFVDFFESKQHKIVPSAPMVIKNDPTLMFTNAGMNQFKDLFLGNTTILNPRIANSQKCLRVSGKHNDLEEVGHDTYHHTMFEMLGNWSFGDYFKQDAIDWAWEFLTKVVKIDPSRMYATIFEGSAEERIERDTEAQNLWLKYLPQSHVLLGNKKDNFWEMGDTGPCGPCTELHVDIRTDAERAKLDGATLVNMSNPLVIEIWNLVFIQYNRKQDGSLELLPARHVDTGMGFERLAMVVQGKQSNYDTDVFSPVINEISRLSGYEYGVNNQADIAMRVIADHIRAISFSIADGQVPSNNKAGYVIRRILRRAVRYAYTFLNQREPFLYKLLPTLAEHMGQAYTELVSQQNLIRSVIFEEETTFLRTLETGIKLLDNLIDKNKQEGYKIVNGQEAFKLYDSYGFPLDLTELILKEHDMVVNKQEFDAAMNRQKELSRADAQVEASDWIEVYRPDEEQEVFIGYDNIMADVRIVRYRKVISKGNVLFHVVFNYTPFYAESGGQVGDSGYLVYNNERFQIIDTQKEHNLIIHHMPSLPGDVTTKYHVMINPTNREQTASNHSATHLLHQALRHVLGTHVEQKGSMVDPEKLRFDFSHYQKLSDEEIVQIEAFVNERIRENHKLDERRAVPIEEAKDLGAMMLFGEKYGDLVRVIKFGTSVELCGGTHVKSTGTIGTFKILKESAIAAGIRRIEGITNVEAERFVNAKLDILRKIEHKFKNSNDILTQIDKLMAENAEFQKQIENFRKEKLQQRKQWIKQQVKEVNGMNVLTVKLDDITADEVKDLAFQLKGEIQNLYLVIGAAIEDKAHLTVMLADNLVADKKLNAGTIIREIAKEVQGGGGGQAFYATAGGKNPAGLDAALNKAVKLIE